MLGLQEAVAVGMADGYAQASGGPALVNLHTAPGVGNAMGAIFNAQANHSPLVITAGQQARSLMTLQANLTNRDATRMPHPLVKWSYEPPRRRGRAAGPRRAAIHLAKLPPKGPTFVSIPMDDWDAEVDDAYASAAIARRSTGARGAGPRGASPSSPAGSRRRRNPVLVAGPGHRRERRLGRCDRARRAPAAARVRDPGDRRRPARLPRGPPELPRHAAAGDRPGRPRRLRGYDLVLVVGSSVFPYYPNIPGPLLPEGAELVAITSDPDEAARAPMGDAIVGRRAG